MALRNSSESPILSSSAIVVFPPFGRLVSSEGTTRWPSSSTAYSNLHTHADTTHGASGPLGVWCSGDTEPVRSSPPSHLFWPGVPHPRVAYSRPQGCGGVMRHKV